MQKQRSKKSVWRKIGPVVAVALAALIIWNFKTVFLIGEIIYLNYFTTTTELTVVGDTLIMNGEINSKSPAQLREIFAQHPSINRIHMGVVPGSLDDDANLEAARFVAEKKLTFFLGRYNLIASGGVDFFLAGQTRIIEEGAQVGVHSWGGAGVSATDFAPGHEYHLPYIDYYMAVGMPREAAEKFYYFTINAAPPDDIHLMTGEELVEYGITTTGITAPAYIIPGVEAARQEAGLGFIAESEAEARGIAIKRESPEQKE